jgi:cysteine sulfinate desulfinase/cysteine desulfurase-like protein
VKELSARRWSIMPLYIPLNIFINKTMLNFGFVNVLPNGHIDLNDLERLLASSAKKTLVTLMHANNEIGNITDINAVGELCKKYKAPFSQ